MTDGVLEALRSLPTDADRLRYVRDRQPLVRISEWVKLRRTFPHLFRDQGLFRRWRGGTLLIPTGHVRLVVEDGAVVARQIEPKSDRWLIWDAEAQRYLRGVVVFPSKDKTEATLGAQFADREDLRLFLKYKELLSEETIRDFLHLAARNQKPFLSEVYFV